VMLRAFLYMIVVITPTYAQFFFIMYTSFTCFDLVGVITTYIQGFSGET
jgi:hypothetical protein